MKVAMAMGSTIFLVVVCMMAAVALTDMLAVGGPGGDQWQALLRAKMLAAYAGGFLLGLGGLFLVVRRAFS